MGSYTVERSITMKAPAPRVHGLVDDFHQWTKWSPWEDLDPELQRTYSGPDQGVGAHYAWTGNRKAGAGSMEITGSTPEEIVDAPALPQAVQVHQHRLRFSFDAGRRGYTNVSWRMDGEQTGLMSSSARFMNMDKLVGPDFEKGLARLKAAAEG